MVDTLYEIEKVNQLIHQILRVTEIINNNRNSDISRMKFEILSSNQS